MSMRHLVKFLVRDNPPKDGLKRMQYYLESENDAEMLSFGTSKNLIPISTLRQTPGLIELPHSILISGMQDIWLGKDREVYVACAVRPFEDKRQVFKI